MLPNRWINRVVIPLALAVLVTGCASLVKPASPTPELIEGRPDILSPDESLNRDAEAYARRYGVAREEAIKRLQFQDGIGELNAALQANEAGTFGGLWIEHEPDYRIVVLFTRQGKQTIRPYLAGKPFANLVEVRQARFSLAELEKIYTQTSGELAKLDFEVNIFLDVTGNRVVITVSDRDWFKGELRRFGVQLPEGVELTVVEGGSTARDKDLLLTPSVPGIAFPRQEPTEGFRVSMMALMVGRLYLEEGCLFVQPLEGNRRLLPIWPPEFTLRIDGDQVLVIDGNGRVAVRAGEEVHMGGGQSGVEAWVLQQIPPACQGEYFIVGGEVRPNLRSDSELFALDVISDTRRTVLFLRYKPELDRQVVEPVSISGGLVAYAYGRCLRLESNMGGSKTLLWPGNWSARLEDGKAVVLDATGQVVAREGEAVDLRGRAIPQDMEFPAYQQLVDELPGDCVGASWLVDGGE